MDHEPVAGLVAQRLAELLERVGGGLVDVGGSLVGALLRGGLGVLVSVLVAGDVERRR